MDAIQDISISQLGFPAFTPVSSLQSVSHLFGISKMRCGIYCLAFNSGMIYIGQSVNAVRRFNEHRKVHDDIVGFTFQPVSVRKLDEVEKSLIQEAESIGFRITNSIHTSCVEGDTDLDLIIPTAKQNQWLDDPYNHNSADDVPNLIELPPSHSDRYAKHYVRYKKHPLSGQATALLHRYVSHCIPHPKITEYSFWSVSCMPSTNKDTWPRLLCVNAAMMELLVVGATKGDRNLLWSFVNVDEEVLFNRWGSARKFRKAYPFVELYRRGYRDAGQNQISLHVEEGGSMQDLLEDESVLKAAASLNLRVMRKRSTIFGKYHCIQLARKVIE